MNAAVRTVDRRARARRADPFVGSIAASAVGDGDGRAEHGARTDRYRRLLEQPGRRASDRGRRLRITLSEAASAVEE